jgi:hypothetical protein
VVRAGFDAILAVTEYDPGPLLGVLLPLLRPSGCLAVFCPELAPLAAAYVAARGSGGMVDVHLEEAWTREYQVRTHRTCVVWRGTTTRAYTQVLPNRTHPTMRTDGASGYLLFGTRVIGKGPLRLSGQDRSDVNDAHEKEDS